MLLLKRLLRMCSTLAKEWTQKEGAIRDKVKDDRGDQILWMMIKGDSRMMTDPTTEGNKSRLKQGDSRLTHVEGCHPQTPTAIVPFVTWAQNAQVSLFPILICTQLVLATCWWSLCSLLLALLPKSSEVNPDEIRHRKLKPASCPCHVSARHPVPAPNSSPARHLTMGVLYSQRLAGSLLSDFSRGGTREVSG